MRRRARPLLAFAPSPTRNWLVGVNASYAF
jgi:hypothetical protein